MHKRASGPLAVVVNDAPILLKVLCAMVRKAGIEPLPFAGAEEALAAMNPEAPPDLIVTDLYMPGLDGWQFCRLLRSPEYAFCNEIPILVVSATFAGDHAERIAGDIGADDFIPSPVDAKTFVARVKALLQGKEARHRPRALIVDDNKNLAGLLKKAFAARGYEADTAHTAREAEAAFDKKTCDVAVLDYHLPDGTGDALLDAFHARRPDCACVMMTTDPTPELALDWMKRGAAAYLRKPFEPEFLIELCARARRERALLRTEDLLEARTRELQVERERLANVIEGTRAATWEWNVQTGEIIVNTRWAEIAGYTLDELAPVSTKTWVALAHPDDLQRSTDMLARHFAGELPYYDCDCRMRHKDGRWVWVRDRGKVTSRTADGQPLRMSGTHIDISDRKEAEEALRLTQFAMDRAPDSILWVDEQGRIVYANHAAFSSMGYKREELEGMTIFEMDPDFPIAGWEQHKIDMKQLGKMSFEGRHLTKSGEAFPVEVSSNYVEYNGRFLSIAFDRDITERKRAEEERKRLEAAVQCTNELVNLATLDGQMTFINEAGATMLGIDPKHVDQINIMQLVPDHLRELVENELLPALSSGGLWKGDLQYRNLKTGELIDVYANTFAVRDPSTGAPAFLANVSLDITERKRAELELARVRSRLEAASNAGRVALWELDIASGRLEWSDAVDMMLGYPTNAFERTLAMWQDCIHPEDRRRVDDALAAHLDHATPYDVEYRVHRADGSWVWWRDTGAANRDDHGKPTSMAGACTDITERKNAEAELRYSEARFRSVIAVSNTGAWEYHADSDYLWCSPEYFSMLGRDPDAFEMDIRANLRETWLDLLHPDDRDLAAQHFAQYLKNGSAGTYEDHFRMRHADGTWVWIWSRGQTLRNPDGSPTDVTVGTHINVTEKRRAEEALTANFAEIERFNRLAVDRELRIRELKRQLAPGLEEPDHPVPSNADQAAQFETLEIAELLDREQMQKLFDSYCDAIGIASAIIDLEGEVFVAARWQRLCTNFHRRHPATCALCIESDTILATQLEARETYTIYTCKNGLTDAASPIIINGRHIANVFVGQFLLAPPNYDSFQRQARKFGFDEASYIEAVAQVPVIAEARIPAILDFMVNCANTVARMGMERMRLHQSAEELRRQQLAALSLAEDATDARHQAEAAQQMLRASQERLLLATRAAGIGIWDWDIANNTLVWDDEMYRLYGIRPEQFDGTYQAWNEALHPDDKERNDAEIQAALLSEREYVPEFRRVWPDGSIHYITGASQTFRDDHGKPVRMIGINIDISERKRAEGEREKLQAQLTQAQKMESVGRLAGGVAHDFNNMLGVILGHAELAQERVGIDDELRADLDEIRKAAQRSAALTRQLLAFARKQTVIPRVLDINETIEGMLKMLRRLIGEDIQLAWMPGENIGPIFIDPSQVDQILANLCVNARDAIDGTGHITIETSAVVFDEEYCFRYADFVPGEYVLMAVSDNGCGMDPETRPYIFEPFFTTKDMGKGTGLGLATVHGIVKQNNGFINVYSEPGLGTTFNIYLPRHTQKAAPRTEQTPAQTPPPHGATILLVEDEPAMLKMTAMMLEKMGYNVVTAETPGEAIRLAREHAGQIDLLITDVVMPEMNGRELAKNLIAIYPDIKRLFMSGYTANVIAHHGVLDKGVHFIHKPFATKDLAQKTQEALNSGTVPNGA